jgi:hypothetical protein
MAIDTAAATSTGRQLARGRETEASLKETFMVESLPSGRKGKVVLGRIHPDPPRPTQAFSERFFFPQLAFPAK